MFKIEHSKAQAIADTVKDVFRDLLSSNDKALANNPEQKSRGNPGGTTYIFGSGGDSSERTPIRFKGALSIGVDTLSNTLVVSTAGDNLMKIVSQTIETLDRAARPVSTVSVVQVGPGVNTAKVSEVLGKLLGEPKPAAQAAPQNGQQQREQARQQARRNGGRGGGNGAGSPQSQ